GGEQQPEHADRRHAEVLELCDDDASVVVAGERVHGAGEAPHRDRRHLPPERDATRYAAACARDHSGPDGQSGGCEERSHLHNSWPGHESSLSTEVTRTVV